MQASVTTVFRSAMPGSSMPICSASPARAWRTTATFSALAGSDISSPVGNSLIVRLSDMSSISAGAPSPESPEHICRTFKGIRYPHEWLPQTQKVRDSIGA